MYNSIAILNLVLKSIFVGFSFIIPILIFVKTSNLKALRLKDMFVLTSVQAVRVAGILCFILALAEFYVYFFDGTSYMQAIVSGFRYISYKLYFPAICLILSQLLWFKKVYMNKVALFCLSLLMIILQSEFCLTLMSNLFSSHYDYLPGSWRVYVVGFYINPVLEIAFNTIVFIFMVSTIIVIGGKLKDKKA